MKNPAQPSRSYPALALRNRAAGWDNQRAQNGPGAAELELWPGPDLSASLDKTEEH